MTKAVYCGRNTTTTRTVDASKQSFLDPKILNGIWQINYELVDIICLGTVMAWSSRKRYSVSEIGRPVNVRR